MKIDVSKVILGLDEKPLFKEKEVALHDKETKQPLLTEEGKPLLVKINTGQEMTFKDVFEQILVIADEKDDSKTKLLKWKLLNKIYKGGKVEISLEEAQLLNNTVQKLYNSTIIIGRVDELLNS